MPNISDPFKQMNKKLPSITEQQRFDMAFELFKKSPESTPLAEGNINVWKAIDDSFDIVNAFIAHYSGKHAK